MNVLKTILMLPILSLAFPTDVGQKLNGRDMTLAQARRALVGKKVIIIGHTSQDYLLKGYLLDWKLAVQSGDEYRETRESVRNYIADSYFGKEAEVIAIQLDWIDKERTGIGGVNALGEKNTDDMLVNPYVDLFVRFPDGTIAMTTSYLSLIFSDSDLTRPLKLVSEKNDRAALIKSQLASIVGKTVYAVGYSELFLPTASLESLMETSSYNAQQTLEFPRLEPMTIVKAVYIDEKDVVVLKLRDADGREYLCLSHFDSRDGKVTFLERVVESYPALLHASIRTALTPREIEAIRKGNIFKGMSKQAVHYTVGFPEKENDWGRNGKQLIYFHNTLFVYIDATEHVVDWQSMRR